MQAPIRPEYTAHLTGAPVRRNWPLVPLVAVMGTAIIAAMAFIFMLIGMIKL